MRRVARRYMGNPSAIYEEGVASRRFLEDERERVAHLLSVRSPEVYFMSGGTEANATLIQGVLRASLESGIKPKEIHVVSSAIEHSSVLKTLRLFERHGVRVTYVAPAEDGIVRADDVARAITPDTVLVTVMYANNEIGTIQPISKIGGMIRKLRAEKMSDLPVFHTDASQAPLWLPCSLEGLRVDAMTLDAHKMEGPRGVGALIVRSHVRWEPLMVGGGQEREMRPTTESIPLIAGFTEALNLAVEGREERVRKVSAVRDALISHLDGRENIVVNGSLLRRLPNNLNISLLTLSDAELAVLTLDHMGIACSTKSSCLKGEEESYVVKTLGGDARRARTTLRFSFGPRSCLSHARRIALAILKL
jgi:cysteine desulfurase